LARLRVSWSSFFLVTVKVDPQSTPVLGTAQVTMDLDKFTGQKLFFGVLFLFRPVQLHFSETFSLALEVGPNFTIRAYTRQPSTLQGLSIFFSRLLSCRSCGR